MISTSNVLACRVWAFALFCAACPLFPAFSADFPKTIQGVKPSIVGIGTFQRTRSPAIVFAATGFVVGDGLSVITNAHAIPATVNSEKNESLGIVVKNGDTVDFRAATVAGIDQAHDLAHLRLTGAPLPALKLGDSGSVVEGQQLAFTGFPLGMMLGLNHVTHRANLAAITPVVMPSLNARRLDVRVITQLQRTPFAIFQLDGTAYPGNSGSPVYDPDTGVVLAILNMVFIKGLKETAITNPSGISYAIPASFARELIQQKPQ